MTRMHKERQSQTGRIQELTADELRAVMGGCDDGMSCCDGSGGCTCECPDCTCTCGCREVYYGGDPGLPKEPLPV